MVNNIGAYRNFNRSQFLIVDNNVLKYGNVDVKKIQEVYTEYMKKINDMIES